MRESSSRSPSPSKIPPEVVELLAELVDTLLHLGWDHGSLPGLGAGGSEVGFLALAAAG
jgi:hypothetical protein